MVNINWKLITVFLISLIIIVICHLSLDIQKYFPKKEKEQSEPELFENAKKIKLELNEDDFKKIKAPDDSVLYYFPNKCPDYKQGFFLVSIENNLEKYYVPEEHHLILIKKDHKWTKEPDNLIYWKSGI
jgi:hypothetical protein